MLKILNCSKYVTASSLSDTGPYRLPGYQPQPEILTSPLCCVLPVCKFLGLQWFFLFKNLYNGEGSLQANKTSKKQNLNLKQ